MSDVVVTVPKDRWFDWIMEGVVATTREGREELRRIQQDQLLTHYHFHGPAGEKEH